MMEYNTTRGSWIGFTPFAEGAAKMWNTNNHDEGLRKAEKGFCDMGVHIIQNIGERICFSILKICLNSHCLYIFTEIFCKVGLN